LEAAWESRLKTPVIAIECLQYGERLTEVEELHVLLNTEPAVGFTRRGGVAEGWAVALRDEAVKRKAVERARRVKHCRL
jgi:hypothetical protein